MFNRQEDIEVPASILLFKSVIKIVYRINAVWEELLIEHFIF